jgi:hypothetical protein
VIISICLKSKVSHHKINPSRKHVTTLICVAAAGDLSLRYVVTISKLNMNFWNEARLMRQRQSVIVKNAKTLQRVFTTFAMNTMP